MGSSAPLGTELPTTISHYLFFAVLIVTQGADQAAFPAPASLLSYDKKGYVILTLCLDITFFVFHTSE